LLPAPCGFAVWSILLWSAVSCPYPMLREAHRNRFSPALEVAGSGVGERPRRKKSNTSFKMPPSFPGIGCCQPPTHRVGGPHGVAETRASSERTSTSAGGTHAPSPAARSGDLLRASHVKPWRNSDHVERLDPANGILLMANIDILFDKGYVSFDDDGGMLTSRLSAAQKRLLGLPGNLKKRPTSTERRYLAYHRQAFGFSA
jgi:hypothetical protein